MSRYYVIELEEEKCNGLLFLTFCNVKDTRYHMEYVTKTIDLSKLDWDNPNGVPGLHIGDAE